jgi:hypothetical protein
VDDIYIKFPTLKLADFESLKKMWIAYGEILTLQKMAEMVEQVENKEKPKKKYTLKTSHHHRGCIQTPICTE